MTLATALLAAPRASEPQVLELSPQRSQDTVASFLRHLADERQVSPHTADAYRVDLGQLAEFLDRQFEGKWEWRDVDRATVREWVADLVAQGVSNRSVARKLSAARSFFRFLMLDSHLESNPVKGMRWPRWGRPLPAHLSRSEAGRLFALLEASARNGSWRMKRDRAILELAYSSGLRVSELAALNLGDVDFDAALVLARGKGRKERLVPVGRPALDALRAYLAVRPQKNTTALFLSRQKPWCLCVRQVRRIAKRWLVKVADRDGLSTHSLRGAFASHLLDNGADLRAVQELLGHASLSTTSLYLHTTRERIRKTYDAAHPMA